jgi:hypothetical protein
MCLSRHPDPIHPLRSSLPFNPPAAVRHGLLNIPPSASESTALTPPATVHSKRLTTPLESTRMRLSLPKSFIRNTYRKRGGGRGSYGYSPLLFSSPRPFLPAFNSKLFASNAFDGRSTFNRFPARPPTFPRLVRRSTLSGEGASRRSAKAELHNNGHVQKAPGPHSQRPRRTEKQSCNRK